MPFRDLPSVDSVLGAGPVAGVAESYSREWLVGLVRRELDQARKRVRQGDAAPSALELAQAVNHQVQLVARVEPRPVINATGVIIHTNLGRAPLSQAATEAIRQAAQGYSDLEFDLDSGRRGSRQAHLRTLLAQLTGAEAALAVNNNASALLLGLSALAAGKEVIVSRGEAVEIGGGFRIPDVLRQSGADLIDVGTTNRTYLRDYEAAITGNTAASAKGPCQQLPCRGVHRLGRNPRVGAVGAETRDSCVARRGQRLSPCHGKVRLGPRSPGRRTASPPEPGLVFLSGDKLLGGPQSGDCRRGTGLGGAFGAAPPGPRREDRQAQLGGPCRYSAALPEGGSRGKGARVAHDIHALGNNQRPGGKNGGPTLARERAWSPPGRQWEAARSPEKHCRPGWWRWPAEKLPAGLKR